MLRHVLSELAIEDPYYALLTLVLIVSIGAVGYGQFARAPSHSVVLEIRHADSRVFTDTALMSFI